MLHQFCCIIRLLIDKDKTKTVSLRLSYTCNTMCPFSYVLPYFHFLTFTDEAAGNETDPLVPVQKEKGPMLGTIWWVLSIIIFSLVVGLQDSYNVYNIFLGWRAGVALLGYVIMQVGLWQAEFKWDEEGSAAYLEAAKIDKGLTPEELDEMDMDTDAILIPDDKKKAAFPIPWGFLIGWWVWGLSYIFPIDGTSNIKPTGPGMVSLPLWFLSLLALTLVSPCRMP
jgi:hypothetical protein